MKAALALLLVLAQEQVDKADPKGRAAFPIAKMAVRVRVTKALPEAPKLHVAWRRGGEGLGGEVVKGDLAAEIAPGAWTEWKPLPEVAGKVGGWGFVTVTVNPPAKRAEPVRECAVEFEFAEEGKTFKTFVEPAPRGGTVGIAVPGGAANREEFVAGLQGLSTYARARRARLEKLFMPDDLLPARFGVIGHLSGYGETGTSGKGGGTGYGTRHCNPEILADECRVQRLLGINGMVGSLRLVDAAGFGDQFRRVYWGGPGAGDPMGIFMKGGKEPDPATACPFDPRVKAHVEEATRSAIESHKAAGAKESWALWDDEMGVYAKEHLVLCARCKEEFGKYLARQGVAPADPYPIFQGKGQAAAPASPEEALRYYYTFRFMTYCTAQVYPEAAKKFREAGILLYAMQGPTPSWAGHSLDWNEFYDLKPNTAFVFETSNRDPRSWQWESFLADIGRGIAARHGLPMGCLVKPHRGAPEQRMLSVVARGTSVLEWYTYGPDYAKGDSFSQRPDLLDRIARAARFLGKAEEFLYGAKWAVAPDVAFCTPRCSEIWGKAANDITPFENAKWVYLALRHAHTPVDVVSEQQLAEGNLGRYKVIYIPGPNLRGDAAAKIGEWVRAGGLLWTDAGGLAYDEANQPFKRIPGDRALERWGRVEPYRATDFKPIAGKSPVTLAWEGAAIEPAVGREIPSGGDVVARYSDGKPAVVRYGAGGGGIYHVGIWAGLTYSAKVRRADFDMRADFDPAIRSLIAWPTLSRAVERPVVPSDPLVEAVLLEKDGKRSVALMNWAYKGRALQPVEKLRVALPAGVTSARSIVHGPLEVKEGAVVLPRMEEIDLLVLE
jgi:hypothetical protein